MKWKASLATMLLICFGAQAFSYGYNQGSWQPIRSLQGPQSVNLWKLNHATHRQSLEDRDENPKNYSFAPQLFRQPLDHFDQKSQYTFHQRYWVNKRYYKPRKGAPVIVLDGGEASAEYRLPLLDTGIVEILARATGGVGVVLEHRYYGESLPVSNLSTDALRFLTNEQAVEDNANFMRNVQFDGIQEDLTAPKTPWIYYGGSYAGARAAHMKILHPDLVWGSIGSSAVTRAILQLWQYTDVIRKVADHACSDTIVNSISIIDDILAGSSSVFKRQLKSLFGLEDLEHDDDFASILEFPLNGWQNKNWDPTLQGSHDFDIFCQTLSKPSGNVTAADMELPFGNPKRMVSIGPGFELDMAIINYGFWIKNNTVSQCGPGSSIEKCFGSYDDDIYRDTSTNQTWRLWLFQQCTQWGYFMTAPPDPYRPRIVSRLMTFEYAFKICEQAFPAGEYYSIPSLPNITAVNALGGFDIAADRLALIDGEVDPWRPCTPHSDYAKDREDTILRPFKLIPNGVHHYDENGLKNILDEPPQIRKIHEEMINFVKCWLDDWDVQQGIGLHLEV